jgi:ATP-dependent DNA helicase 2 subunit 2
LQPIPFFQTKALPWISKNDKMAAPKPNLKSATVYVVDVGDYMSKCHNGRNEDDLEWSMQYVWDKLAATALANRATLLAGFVALNTEDSDNELSYESISVYKPVLTAEQYAKMKADAPDNLGPVSMSTIRDWQAKIVPSRETGGDALDAVEVAIDMIERVTKRLKFDREIVLVTNAQCPIDSSKLQDVCDRLNDNGIKLVVL